MVERIKNFVRFHLERFLLRGPLHRLSSIAFLIAAIALTAGLLAYSKAGVFPTVSDAIWWAFLRLTDSGYLGDDKGVFLRAISTIVTLLGFVVFLGALVAIMTQWFQQTMARLQAGTTPIAQKQHILVLGWTNRTATIVQELFLSEGRVKRFLQRFGLRRMRIVLLAHQDAIVTADELKSQLEYPWDPKQLVIRSGNPMRVEHLERVAFLDAAVVLLPARELEDPLEATVDGDAIKSLIAITDEAKAQKMQAPLAVVELMDARKVSLVKRAYGGPIEVVSSDQFVARLLVQNLRHRGVSHVYSELLGNGPGNEIYLRDSGDLTGSRFCELQSAFSKAIPIGLIRHNEGQLTPQLNPPGNQLVQKSDRIILIAEEYDHATADHHVQQVSTTYVEHTEQKGQEIRNIRILVLGWNHKAPTLIRELDSYAYDHFEIDIVSRTTRAERDALMERLDVAPENTNWRQIEADFTSPSDLARLNPSGYDSILLLAGEWTEPDAANDARTTLGYLVLHDLLVNSTTSPTVAQPHVLVELLNPDNVGLFLHRDADVLVSPVVVSHVLTQVALRRELRAVFEELFGPNGPEIYFRRIKDAIGPCDNITFADVQRKLHVQGQIALGLRTAANKEHVPGGIVLNPERSKRLEITAADEIIVLADRDTQ